MRGGRGTSARRASARARCCNAGSALAADVGCSGGTPRQFPCSENVPGAEVAGWVGETVRAWLQAIPSSSSSSISELGVSSGCRAPLIGGEDGQLLSASTGQSLSVACCKHISIVVSHAVPAPSSSSRFHPPGPDPAMTAGERRDERTRYIAMVLNDLRRCATGLAALRAAIRPRPRSRPQH